MYINVIINDRVRTTYNTISLIELRNEVRVANESANRAKNEADRAESEADRAETILVDVALEGETQIARIQDTGNTENSRVISQGDTQVSRVTSQGNTQVARVTAEGDIQFARSKVEADRAEDQANIATARADEIKSVTVVKPVTSVPNKPNGEAGDPDVDYDAITGAFTFAIPQGVKGEQGETGVGFIPQGGATVAEINALTEDPLIGVAYWMLDSGTITYGSQPVDVVTNDIIVWVGNGYFFNAGPLVIGSNWGSISDVTVNGTPTADGQDLAFAIHEHVWNDIVSGIPENVSNALSRAGGTMTGQIKGIAPIADADVTRKDYVDAEVVTAKDYTDSEIIAYDGVAEGKFVSSIANAGDGTNRVPNMVSCTQEDFDALTPDPSTLYLILPVVV